MMVRLIIELRQFKNYKVASNGEKWKSKERGWSQSYAKSFQNKTGQEKLQMGPMAILKFKEHSVKARK